MERKADADKQHSGANPSQTRANLPVTVVLVDEARAVIERLDRIDVLERAGAPHAAVLDELRGLLHDAEAWVRIDGDEHAEEVVVRCGAALAQPVP